MVLANCGSGTTSSTGATSAPATTAVTPNAATQVASWSGTQTVTQSGGTATQKFAVTTTARTTIRGSDPASVDLTTKGTFSASTTGTASSCTGSPDLYAQNNFSFTISHPMLVTLAVQASGSNYVEAKICQGMECTYQSSYGIFEDQQIEELNGNVTNTIYLPAGEYTGFLEGDLYQQDIAANANLNASVHSRMTFSTPGSATAGPSGAGTRYVTMSRALRCSPSRLQTTVTHNRVLLGRISKIAYARNGRVVRVVAGRAIKPGLGITISGLNPTSASTARITVYLKSGKRLSESASYLPCSL